VKGRAIVGIKNLRTSAGGYLKDVHKNRNLRPVPLHWLDMQKAFSRVIMALYK
jgi:hypothetical protein